MAKSPSYSLRGDGKPLVEHYAPGGFAFVGVND